MARRCRPRTTGPVRATPGDGRDNRLRRRRIPWLEAHCPGHHPRARAERHADGLALVGRQVAVELRELVELRGDALEAALHRDERGLGELADLEAEEAPRRGEVRLQEARHDVAAVRAAD